MTDIVGKLGTIAEFGTKSFNHADADIVTEAADTITALRAENERLRAHITEQITIVETRIKDGDEMGARVWRIALEDVASEAQTALAAGGSHAD